MSQDESKDAEDETHGGSVFINLGFPELMQRAVWAVRRFSEGHYSSTDAVLYSAMAAEAFPNDFGHMVNTFAGEDADVPELITAGQIMPQLEQQRVQPKTKYLILYYVLKKEPFPTSDRLWSDFDLLLNLRNEIAHAKPDNVTWGANGQKRSSRKHRLFDALRSRNLTDRPPGAEPAQWGFMLDDSDAVGRWAINTTKKIVQLVAGATPPSRLRDSYIDGFIGAQSSMNKPAWPG